MEKTGHSVDPSLWTNPQKRRGESVRPAAPLRLHWDPPPRLPNAVFYCNNDLWMKARPPSVAAAPSSDPDPALRQRREVIFLTLIQLLGKKDPQPNLSLNLKEIATEGGVGGVHRLECLTPIFPSDGVGEGVGHQSSRTEDLVAFFSLQGDLIW